jgi:tetratricopeptide (TPR) repeat protein
LKYCKKYVEMLKSLGQTPQGYEQYIGYAYWKNGYKNEANAWFNDAKKLGQESIKLGRAYKNLPWTFYNLAHVYAFTGEKEKAYEMLEKTRQYKAFPLFMIDDMKTYNPLFKYIRNEFRFQMILKEMEAKYQAEHERVRKWLEGNKML